MPELPEVETVVNELRQAVRNKTIKNVQVKQPKMIAIGPLTLPNIRKIDKRAVAKFQKILKNQKVKNISRRAKSIIIDFVGPYSLFVHLKMTGQLIYLSKKDLSKSLRLLNIENYPSVSLPAKWTHVIFEFTDGSKLFYNDMRQFGYLKLVHDKEVRLVPELAGYGPEPLEKKFNFAVFQNITKQNPKAKLKSFLMDQTKIAGIGNIYSDEICFFAKVKPDRMLKTLRENEQLEIFNGIKRILQQAVKMSGSSVGDFVRPFGKWGSYGKVHKVYGRTGKKCLICASMIVSKKFNGRTGSFCPKCQK
jgi:formamidopyrimidine-DNA glycosylase